MYIPKNLIDKVDPVPVDTMAPLACFAAGGYYIVDGKIFRNKVYAMQEATRKRLKPMDVMWIFNNDVYDSLDWKTPTDVNLPEIYRSRAQQLREKYDYLILSFSGGGDSSNVLDSFVRNNIHLDEVMVYWPRAHTSGKYVPSLDPDAKNFLSEWDYLIEPKLKWLQTAAPKTRITVLDPHESLNRFEPDENLATLTSTIHYIGYQRFTAVDRLLLDRQRKFKNCALIRGINPPVPSRVRHLFVIDFNDTVIATYSSDVTLEGLSRNVENFYWTPDMPEIPQIQGHALLQNLCVNPNYIDLLFEWEIGGPKKTKKNRNAANEILRRWIKSILYPTYDYTSLQVNKNTSPIYRPEWCSWFYDNLHSNELIQPHHSAVISHQNLISPDFFVKKDGAVHDWYCFRSKLYHIGNLPDQYRQT